MKVHIKVYRFWYKISKCPHFSTVLLRNKELWTSLIHITLTLVARLHLKQESTAPGLRREETRISSSWAVIYGLVYVILLHLRSCSHVPGGLLHSSKENCSKRTPAVPFHVPHDPCAVSSLTFPSSTDSRAHQTCSNFALLRHFAGQEVKPGWVRWYCGWLDAISPPLKQVLYRSRDAVGLLVLLSVRLGKVALKRRHYHNASLVMLVFFG